jgi:hypothetical protein
VHVTSEKFSISNGGASVILDNAIIGINLRWINFDNSRNYQFNKLDRIDRIEVPNAIFPKETLIGPHEDSSAAICAGSSLFPCK